MDEGGRVWPRWVAVAVAPALAAMGTVVVLRAGHDTAVDAGDEPATDDTPAGDVVALGPSGLVVELARLVPELPAGAGVPTTFHVDVAATTDIVRVELWEAGEPTAVTVPPPGFRQLGTSLEWTPKDAGTSLITARAVDAAGRVGLSNPLWIEVTDVPRVVIYGADGSVLAPETEPVGAVGAVGAVGLAGRSAPARTRAADHARLADLPRLGVTANGCGADLIARPASGAPPGRLVVLRIAPASAAMVPVTELTGDGDGATSIALDGGLQAFVLAEVSEGVVRGWSPPVTVDVGAGCRTPGWEGEVSLVDGRLPSTTAATAAYLYVEAAPGRWTRVPAEGTVPRTRAGFDFSAHLPPLPGAFSVSAWGWAGDELVHIGDASYSPPAATSAAIGDGSTGVLLGAPSYVLPPVTLRWIEQPATKGQPEVLSTAGVIDVDANGGQLGSYRFRWTVPYLGVTHGIVQVGLGPFAGSGGPLSAFSLATCVVAGSGGDFVVDFDSWTCAEVGQEPVTVVAKDQGTYDAIVAAPAAIGGDPTDLVSEVDPLSELEQQLDGPEMQPSDQTPWAEELVVRVVPMTNDTWNGKLSNEVVFEVDRTPKAPAGVPAYGMDVQLVTAPRAPDIRYANCWEFVGWQDPAAAFQAAAQERAQLDQLNQAALIPLPPSSQHQPHAFWTEYAKQVSPICAPSCEVVAFGGEIGSWTVGLGGADCSSSSFWSDPVGWVVDNLGAPFVAVIKAIVDLAANGFAKLKGFAVDALLTITQCSGEWCTAIAEAVVNGALIAVGVPPTLPNFDQLVQLGKGELVDLAVDLATAAGVPCDEAGAAATLHGDDDLTCEAAIEALIDEVGAAVNQQFQQVASAGGLTFPSDMIIKPWWAGQPGPAVVDVTITPTKYTAEEQGATCSAGVLTSVEWTAPGTKIPIPGLGTAAIPQTSWQTMAYEIPTWKLPDLSKGSTLAYEPRTKRYTLYPPVGHPQVTVQRQVKMLASTVGVPVQVSPYTFYFHEGATFHLHVGSSCAGWETHVYTLDGTYDGAHVSVEEGP